jgi:hypothetical protein
MNGNEKCIRRRWLRPIESRDKRVVVLDWKKGDWRMEEGGIERGDVERMTYE